jgi:hypothetical protein
VKRFVTVLVLIGALFVAAPAAHAKPRKKPAPIPMAQVWQWAEEDTFNLWLAIPEAIDYGYNCYRTSRSTATCDESLWGYFIEDGSGFQCDWQEYFWTKVRPKNKVFYDFSEPLCYSTSGPLWRGEAKAANAAEDALADAMQAGVVAR